MENPRFDLNQIRENVNLVDTLSRLGYEPLRKSGGELFYLSMLRDNDSAPSFCVNKKAGLWYDHGMGKGGNVIDFAVHFWPNLTFKEAVEELIKVSGNSVNEIQGRPFVPRQTELILHLPSYIIRESKELGGNKSISNYLQGRGVMDVSANHLKELYYSVKLKDGTRREMFAAGWQNELGGWEVRNAYFKGCLGKKAMSFISGNPETIVLFEGMLDFLSWKKLSPLQDASVLVLNSLSFLDSAIQRAGKYRTIELFFDHDSAGKKATMLALSQLPQAVDQSAKYEGYNDFNEKLTAMIHAEKDPEIRKANPNNVPLRNR